MSAVAPPVAGGPDGRGRRVLAPLFAVVSIDAMGNGAILPLLPFYAERMGATPLMLGCLIAAYWLCQLLAAPVLGALSDRVGRKRVLVGSQLGTLAGFAILATAPSLAFVFLGRIVDGLTSGNLAVASAYAIDRSGGDRRRAVGVVGAGLGLGTMVGPALAGMLSQVSLSAPFWAAAALSACSIAASARLLPSDRRAAAANGAVRAASILPGRGILAAAMAPGARSALAMLVLYYLSFGMFLSQFALFAAARLEWSGAAFGPREVGIAFAAAGAINVFVQLVAMKPLGRLVRDRALACACFAAVAAGYLGLAAGPAPLTWAPAILLVSIGAALARPALLAAFSQAMPEGRQGAAMGLNQSVMALANIAAALLAGLLIGWGWYLAWSGALAALAILGALVALWRPWPPVSPTRPQADT